MQDGLKKLQTFDSSCFIGQSYLINDGSLNFLILQTVFIILKWQLLLQTQSLNGDLKGYQIKKIDLPLQQLIIFLQIWCWWIIREYE